MSYACKTSAVALSALFALLVTACAHGYEASNQPGVYAPRGMEPLWLGSIQPVANAELRGAAAVAPSSVPHWAHVLVSIKGATPASTYSWRLHSGRCTDNGPTIGPDDRYAPLIAFDDGTAAAESLLPTTLSASTLYSVTISGPAAGCADLAYGSM